MKYLIITLVYCFNSINALAFDIMGEWKDQKTGAIVSIYSEDNKFYAEVLSSGNKEEDLKLKNKKLFLLTNFVQKTANEYCCGTIYLPRKKIYAEGTLIQANDSTLIVKGHYSFLTYTMEWKKLL